MGSRGASSTAENRLIITLALNGEWKRSHAPVACTRAVHKRGVSIVIPVGHGDSLSQLFLLFGRIFFDR
ncbi:hypothetical protein D3C81_738010 [compost metagenome]